MAQPMSMAIICYALLAIGLCTIHLCLGVCIGVTVESRRRKEDLPKIERPIAQSHSRLAEIISLANRARELSEACHRYERLIPPSIILQAVSLAQESAKMQSRMESIDRLRARNRSQGKSRSVQTDFGFPSQGERGEVSADKSRQSSFRYEVWQYVAPMEGETMPTGEQFKRVLCCNLSCNGFSYLAPELPSTGSLIVALGSPPGFRFVRAKVVSSKSASLSSGQPGQLIESRFVETLLQVYQWDEAEGRITSVCSLGEIG